MNLPFQGSTIAISNGGPNLGLPVIDVALGPYWDEHDSKRLFFPQKATWQMRWGQRRPQPEWSGPSTRR